MHLGRFAIVSMNGGSPDKGVAKPMTLLSGLSGLLGCSFLASLVRLASAPATWMTDFFDGAEEIWVQDPFLSDDDDAWQGSDLLAPSPG